ncbi:MAG: transposase [Rhodospirillales bacterium]|nr:transposase [Rhodospirillales bacterium]
MFHTLAEAKVLIEQWRRHDNTLRPHSALGYRPPAPEVLLPMPWLPTGSGSKGSSQSGMIMAHQHFARTTQWGLVICGTKRLRAQIALQA